MTFTWNTLLPKYPSKSVAYATCDNDSSYTLNYFPNTNCGLSSNTKWCMQLYQYNLLVNNNYWSLTPTPNGRINLQYKKPNVLLEKM